MLIVERESVWTRRKAVIIAAVVGATSVGAWRVLDQINQAMDYELSIWVFAPFFFGLVLIYPIAAIAMAYKHLPTAIGGLCFAVGFGLAWYLTVESIQLVEYSAWKGIQVQDRTLATLVVKFTWRFVIVMAVTVPAMMGVWGVCRLARGKVLIQDGFLCGTCGYSLTGNVSGACPECGAQYGDNTA